MNSRTTSSRTLRSSVAPEDDLQVRAPLAIPTDVQLRSSVAPEGNRYMPLSREIVSTGWDLRPLSMSLCGGFDSSLGVVGACPLV